MYSLGWTLWELASRRIPFHNATSNELIPIWVRDGEREDIPQDCPDRLASVIKSSWHGDPTYRPEAEAVALLLVSGGAQTNIGAGPSVSVAIPPPSPLVKPLEKLTDEELERWLTSIRIPVVIPRLREQGVTAEVMSFCESVQELEQYGLSTGHARLLMRRIEEVRVGVQITAIAPPQIPPPAPLRPPAPTPPPGNEVGLIKSISNLISNHVVTVYPCMCCDELTAIAFPHRPSTLAYTPAAPAPPGRCSRSAFDYLIHPSKIVHSSKRQVWS